jgi:hypothetical protein
LIIQLCFSLTVVELLVLLTNGVVFQTEIPQNRKDAYGTVLVLVISVIISISLLRITFIVFQPVLIKKGYIKPTKEVPKGGTGMGVTTTSSVLAVDHVSSATNLSRTQELAGQITIGLPNYSASKPLDASQKVKVLSSPSNAFRVQSVPDN